MLIPIFFIVLCATNAYAAQSATPVLTFFIKTDPTAQTQSLEKTLRKSTKLARTYLKKHLSSTLVTGVYASCAGYITASDYNGQITLPRGKLGEKVTILITPTVIPVPLRQQTIQHFVVKEQEPRSVYLAQRSQNPRTKQFLWNIQPARLTSDRIPSQALIIFGDPASLMMPLGTFVTDGGPNLVLPPLISTKEHPGAGEALKLLKYNRYFAPVQKAYQFTPERYASMIKL